MNRFNKTESAIFNFGCCISKGSFLFFQIIQHFFERRAALNPGLGGMRDVRDQSKRCMKRELQLLKKLEADLLVQQNATLEKGKKKRNLNVQKGNGRERDISLKTIKGEDLQ